ncbi:MAG TPA: VOC family protein [Myxococcales bacterium]|nr:VOC family protein [Myxococcales bacterium]
MTLQLRVCVDVEDLEKAVAFYRDALGLTEGRRLGAHWAEMLGASSPLDLLAQPAGTPASPRSAAVRDYRRHWTPVHFDCVVPDVDAAVARAQAAGATLDREIETRNWGRLAVLADPFGNGFCLLELRGRGYDEMLGG